MEELTTDLLESFSCDFIIEISGVSVWYWGATPFSKSCISSKLMPLVSGRMMSTKKNAKTEQTANDQKTTSVPNSSARIGNSLVRMKPAAQQHDEVKADAIAFTFGGKTSAITAHGSGPNPGTKHMTVIDGFGPLTTTKPFTEVDKSLVINNEKHNFN